MTANFVANGIVNTVGVALGASLGAAFTAVGAVVGVGQVIFSGFKNFTILYGSYYNYMGSGWFSRMVKWLKL
ncbi:hypothetical protein [Mucilaginibacter panaciglaebae]|uniref:Uncharacterized protein n=1 Tax=Mucilaginibacter panaciglaebae TaxID=502331 RepID=A0ABP7X4A1_9SPHI